MEFGQQKGEETQAVINEIKKTTSWIKRDVNKMKGLIPKRAHETKGKCVWNETMYGELYPLVFPDDISRVQWYILYIVRCSLVRCSWSTVTVHLKGQKLFSQQSKLTVIWKWRAGRQWPVRSYLEKKIFNVKVCNKHEHKWLYNSNLASSVIIS